MGKGIILLFLSEYRSDNEPLNYEVEDIREQGRTFEGTQTNDAPVKYLLHNAADNGDRIEKIVCIVTAKVKEQKSDEKFQKMVNDYIQTDQRLSDYYQDTKIEFSPVKYNEEIKDTEKRSLDIYSQMSKVLLHEEQSSIYIDYTGGLRDTSFLMTIIIRYLEYHNSICKRIVYSNKNKTMICVMDCIYDMFQLLNGVDQFTRTGNAELLEKCSEKEKDEKTKDLLEKIVKFSKVMSICDIKAIDEHFLTEIDNGLKNYEKNAVRVSLFSGIFRDMIGIIKKKLYIEEGKKLGYPELIRWCLDNNMIQQALTLYIEKMPPYYYDTDMLIFPKEMPKLSPGKTKERTAFYEALYGELSKDEKLEHFKQTLQELNLQNGKLTVDVLLRKRNGVPKEEQVAISRLAKMLKTYYDDGVGNRTPRRNLPKIYGNQGSNPNTGIGYINDVINKKDRLHYFFYNNKTKYDQMKKIGTYQEKVLALDKLKNEAIKIRESKISNEMLYQIMKYYLALTLMRNRVNHAVEEENKADEEQAIKRLKNDHGLCMDIEFDNVKKLIRDGLEVSGIPISNN